MKQKHISVYTIFLYVIIIIIIIRGMAISTVPNLTYKALDMYIHRTDNPTKCTTETTAQQSIPNHNTTLQYTNTLTKNMVTTT